jgi:hypothetical protein
VPNCTGTARIVSPALKLEGEGCGVQAGRSIEPVSAAIATTGKKGFMTHLHCNLL